MRSEVFNPLQTLACHTSSKTPECILDTPLQTANTTGHKNAVAQSTQVLMVG